MRFPKPTFKAIWPHVLTLGMVLNLFLLRPAAMGQEYTPVGMAGAAVVLLMYVFWSHKTHAKVTGSLRLLALVGLLTGYYLYEGILVSTLGMREIEPFAKEWAALFLVLACYGPPLANPNMNRMFFGKFAAVIALLGASAGVTVVLAALVGLEPLYLTRIAIKGYTSQDLETGVTAGAIYFPFSMVYNRFATDAVDLFRFSGFFREAGIFQAFCCSAFVYEALTRARRWVMAGAIAGAVASFSTIGLAVMVMSFGLVYALRRPGAVRKRLAGVVVLAACAVAAAVYTPHIGLLAKGQTHSTTVSDRSEALGKSVDLLLRNPLGTGPFTWADAGLNAGITLLTQMGYLGAVGFALHVLAMSGWGPRPGRQRLQRMACCAPVLVTALMSQPLTGAPTALVLALCSVPLAPHRHSLWIRLRFWPRTIRIARRLPA